MFSLLWNFSWHISFSVVFVLYSFIMTPTKRCCQVRILGWWMVPWGLLRGTCCYHPLWGTRKSEAAPAKFLCLVSFCLTYHLFVSTDDNRLVADDSNEINSLLPASSVPGNILCVCFISIFYFIPTATVWVKYHSLIFSETSGCSSCLLANLVFPAHFCHMLV